MHYDFIAISDADVPHGAARPDARWRRRAVKVSARQARPQSEDAKIRLAMLLAAG
jgi:hypothetical protein